LVQPILVDKGRGQMRHGWNIGANVGARSPNNDDDVQLVQFGYFCMSKHGDLPGNVNELIAKVPLGSKCSGSENDPLVRVIRAHEAFRGGTQDGHVSALRDSNPGYIDASGQQLLILAALLNNMFDEIGGKQWPRIQDHPKCPTALKLKLNGLSQFAK